MNYTLAAVMTNKCTANIRMDLHNDFLSGKRLKRSDPDFAKPKKFSVQGIHICFN